MHHTRALLISSSNVYGHGYLDQPEPYIVDFLRDQKRVHFVPFALYDHDAYTALVAERLGRMGLEVVPLRTRDELAEAKAIFVGGGNTWRLLKTLYERELVAPMREAVKRGVPYIGSSAGSNIASPTIRTTNDMPIVEVPSMNALGIVPYQINPHYLDAEPNSTHMGETREERIVQFHEENVTPVIGLREGTALLAERGTTTLLGMQAARVFLKRQEPYEVEPGMTIELP
jgi:dipeptidase E